jgi:hypothetical protein
MHGLIRYYNKEIHHMLAAALLLTITLVLVMPLKVLYLMQTGSKSILTLSHIPPIAKRASPQFGPQQRAQTAHYHSVANTVLIGVTTSLLLTVYLGTTIFLDLNMPGDIILGLMCAVISTVIVSTYSFTLSTHQKTLALWLLTLMQARDEVNAEVVTKRLDEIAIALTTTTDSDELIVLAMEQEILEKFIANLENNQQFRSEIKKQYLSD